MNRNISYIHTVYISRPNVFKTCVIEFSAMKVSFQSDVNVIWLRLFTDVPKPFTEPLHICYWCENIKRDSTVHVKDLKNYSIKPLASKCVVRREIRMAFTHKHSHEYYMISCLLCGINTMASVVFGCLCVAYITLPSFRILTDLLLKFIWILFR